MKRPSQSIERLPVFVYGTLRRRGKNYRRYLAGRTLSERAGTVRGELYFVTDGGYPYIVEGDATVYGEVMELAPALYDETLRRLDELEEYDPLDEARSVYLRRRVAVRLEEGDEVVAWTYYWNRPQVRGQKVPGGDFLRMRDEG